MMMMMMRGWRWRWRWRWRRRRVVVWEAVETLHCCAALPT